MAAVPKRARSSVSEAASIDPSYCSAAPPTSSQACNEDACAPSEVDVGAFETSGTCGVLGVLGPGFILRAGATEALPVGTTITVVGSGVANIGVFSITGATATVSVLSPTSRQIVLTSAPAAGGQMAIRTTLYISIAFSLSAAVTLPDGYVATGAKTTGSVDATLVMCSGS